MNTKKRLIIIGVLLVVGLLAVKRAKMFDTVAEEKHNHTQVALDVEKEAVEDSIIKFQVEGRFKEQFSEVMESYMTLKEALVASNLDQASSTALAMKNILTDMNVGKLEGIASNDWKNYQYLLERSLLQIHSEKEIGLQREAFNHLSNNLYKTIDAFGLNAHEVYYQYCPMAFNNAGGYWLSDEKAIRNPYFGEMMLTCGEVKNILKI